MNASAVPSRLPPHPLSRRAALSWTIGHLSGRLVEFSGADDTCALTYACRLIGDAQRREEPVAWIARTDSTFFPPDVARCGVDLDGLVVVRPRDLPSALRAADQLLRSTAFGLVVIDLREGDEVPLPLLARLSGMARRCSAVVLFLTEKPPGAASLGPLVSLHAECRHARVGADLFRLRLLATKNKHGAPDGEYTATCRGPAGLR